MSNFIESFRKAFEMIVSLVQAMIKSITEMVDNVSI